METPTHSPMLAADVVGVAEFAEIQGKTERTVRMWLNNDEVPGAVRNDRGVWAIPRHAMRNPRPLDVEREQAAVEKARAELTVADVLERHTGLLTVEQAAALLGITPFAVRKHADDLDGRYWGDNGALVIPQAAIRRILGI